MKKVTSYQLIDGLRENVKLIIGSAILIFALVGGFIFIKSDGLYEASAVLMATSTDDNPISYNKLMLNEKLANIYGEILKSPDLYEDVEMKAVASSTYKQNESYKQIMDQVEYQVNPQAGLISFKYSDKNEEMAKKILEEVCEQFKTKVREYLKVDNLSYLQEVRVNKTSLVREMIFSFMGLILGIALGIFLAIVKTLLTDKIVSEEGLYELGYDVFGSFAKNGEGILKIKAVLENRLEEGIVGITSLAKESSFEFSDALAKAFSKNNGILFVDTKDKADIGDKYLSSAEDLKIIRKGSIDFVSLPKDKSAEILDSNEFFANVVNKENSYNYIFIDEKQPDLDDTFISSKYQDLKIILVDKDTKIKELERLIRDYGNLGIGVCGVVYYK